MSQPLKPLDAKHRRFVAEYLKDLNATQAAIRAGYARANADVTGPRLLGNVGIAAAIAAGQQRHLEKAELSATRVLEELRRLAFIDIRGFFDAGGNIKPIHQLSDDEASALQSVDVVIKNVEAGDGVTDTVHKFKLWDKTRALEMLAKHYALLKEVVKHEVEDQLIEKLLAGRKRAAARTKGTHGE